MIHVVIYGYGEFACLLSAYLFVIQPIMPTSFAFMPCCCWTEKFQDAGRSSQLFYVAIYFCISASDILSIFTYYDLKHIRALESNHPS